MTLAKTANQTVVTVSGHDIEMHKGGSGPPLLFLHGGGGFGTFDPTGGPLAEKFTVYAPSHPGFFGSGRPDWLYTIVDLAHFYKDMVQQLGLENYVLVESCRTLSGPCHKHRDRPGRLGWSSPGWGRDR